MVAPKMTPNQARLEASAAYAEKHKVYELFEGLLSDLLVQKPADPIGHMIASLKTPSGPRVLVTGPPSSDTRSQCELISSKLGLVHVYAPDAWMEASKAGTEAGLKAKALVDSGEEISDALLLEMLKEKLTSAECTTKGWVLEGYPTTGSQAKAMLAAGLLPTRVLLLQLDDAEVKRRLVGRRIDTEKQVVYHLEDAPPPDAETAARLVQREDDTEEKVEVRLETYRRSAAAVLPYFPKVLSELDASLPKETLCEAALPLITPNMPSRAPRGCPRVVLLGGPGSGAEALGEELAAFYGARLVSAPQLLQAAALSGSVTGAKVKPFLDKGEPELVPDKLVNSIVFQRLMQEDVRTQGFVLQGYPATSEQAAWYAKHGGWVRHAVHLELSNEAAKRRVTKAVVDPIDGTAYHPDDPGYPADPATRARLVPALNSSDGHVKKMLSHWRAAQPKLFKQYADQLVTLDATLPTSTLVEKLASCFIVKA